MQVRDFDAANIFGAPSVFVDVMLIGQLEQLIHRLFHFSSRLLESCHQYQPDFLPIAVGTE
jgi:hypothetical protein